MRLACEQIGLRAQAAALGGALTFPLPEASEAAAWVARTAPDPAMRAEAAAWLAAGAAYHALVRLCARAVVAMDGVRPGGYRAKVAGELEPMLALWPHVLVFPTAETLTAMEMIQLRAFPVHPLGLADGPAWTDGALAPASEFFFHDLDHARFKVREDLVASGLDLPDAYEDGTTVEPNTGRHRLIVSSMQGLVGQALWDQAPGRAALALRLRDTIAGFGGHPLAGAAELLLFEVVHEKSFPLTAAILERELVAPAHIEKLRNKVARGFFPTTIGAEVVAALPAAGLALKEALA